jgi:hypothetical protein
MSGFACYQLRSGKVAQTSHLLPRLKLLRLKVCHLIGRPVGFLPQPPFFQQRTKSTFSPVHSAAQGDFRSGWIAAASASGASNRASADGRRIKGVL